MGQNYDLLIFISTIDYYKAYFIQICTNKNRNLIYIIKNDLIKNEQPNKDIFAKFIDTYISEIKIKIIFFNSSISYSIILIIFETTVLRIENKNKYNNYYSK